MEMECLRQKASALHESATQFKANIKLSGQGVRSHQGHTTKHFCQDSGGGDPHAYAYLAIKFERELHDFTTTLTSSAAARVTNTLFIDIGGNDRNETNNKSLFNISLTPSSSSMLSLSKKSRYSFDKSPKNYVLT